MMVRWRIRRGIFGRSGWEATENFASTFRSPEMGMTDGEVEKLVDGWEGELPVPANQFGAREEPEEGAESQVGAKRNACGPLSSADEEGEEADHRAEDGRAHDGEGDGLPAKEGTNAGDEFNIP